MIKYTDRELEGIFAKIISIDLLHEIEKPAERRILFYTINDAELRDYVSEAIKITKDNMKKTEEDVVRRKKLLDQVKSVYEEKKSNMDDETKEQTEILIDKEESIILYIMHNPPDLQVQDIVMEACRRDKTDVVNLKYKTSQDYETFNLKTDFLKVVGIQKLLSILD